MPNASYYDNAKQNDNQHDSDTNEAVVRPLQWRHNGRDSISNHQPHDCLLNRLFRHRSRKTSKLRVTGLCAGNSPGTGEFAAQRASNAENVSIWWRHHDRGKAWPLQVHGQCVLWFVCDECGPGCYTAIGKLTKRIFPGNFMEGAEWWNTFCLCYAWIFVRWYVGSQRNAAWRQIKQRL